MNARPSVTVAVPVLNEERHLAACLEAVVNQTYPNIIEVLVVDGGSTDLSVAIAGAFPRVRIIHNPSRIQAAGLNLALRDADGEVFIRVDGHTVVAPDYVERCVDALAATGAAIVGGAMTPVATGTWPRGIAAALRSPFGAGPARFHTGGRSGWVDTVYMGAYRTDLARTVGGYADVPINEDAEFAIRMRDHGGVWFDASIRSAYTPREDLRALARQFYRYGSGRAVTLRRHPSTIAPRQLAPLLLVVGLATPWRMKVAASYVALVGTVAALHGRREPSAGLAMAAAVPTMHFAWAAGFLREATRRRGRHRQQ